LSADAADRVITMKLASMKVFDPLASEAFEVKDRVGRILVQRVRRAGRRHEPQLATIRLREWASRPGHGAGEVRRQRLRLADGTLDGKGSERLRRRRLNLYGYVVGDPQNFAERSGRSPSFNEVLKVVSDASPGFGDTLLT